MSGFFEEVVVLAGALTLTGIIVGLRLEWGGFGYALVVRQFRRCPEVEAGGWISGIWRCRRVRSGR